MAWIKVIPREEATGELVEQYDRIGGPNGSVANILAVHSLNPAALRAHHDLYRTIMFGPSELSRPQREMIAVVVSSANRCHYWVAHHAEGLRRAGKDAAFVAAVVGDYRTAPITAGERAMLDFAAQLTRSPWDAAEADVEGLRRMGLSDRAILDLVLVIAYFAFVNRIADGLGVELEPAT